MEPGQGLQRLFMPWRGSLLRPAAVVLQVQERVAGLSKPGALQKVLSLHLDSFWHHHGRKVIAAVAVVGAYFLWCGLAGSS